MNLISIITLFGRQFDWELETAMFWLLIAQVVLILFLVIVFAVLIHRVGKAKYIVREKGRTLMSLSLDLSAVDREFVLGTPFDCSGLIVTANYSSEPAAEHLTEFTVITAEEFAALKDNENKDICYVVIPSILELGKKTITVKYQGMTALYVISVVQFKEEQPVRTEYVVAPTVRTLMSISLDTSSVNREFTLGDAFDCSGLLVKANYNVEPIQEIITDYTVLLSDEYAALIEQLRNAEEELTLAENAYNEQITARGFADDDATATLRSARLKAEQLRAENSQCMVIVPEIDTVGKKTVTVKYRDMTTMYVVTIVEKQEQPEQPEQPVEEVAPVRTLKGITLDTSVVDREFTLGDEFNCDGLIVTALYDLEPMTEIITEFKVVSAEEYAALTETEEPETVETEAEGEPETVESEPEAVEAEAEGEPETVESEPEAVEAEAEGEPETVESEPEAVEAEAETEGEPENDFAHQCIVVMPAMDELGKKNVMIRYGDAIAMYAISVVEREPEPVEEEIAASEEKQIERSLICISLDASAVKKEYNVGDEFDIGGLIVTAHYNEEPYEEIVDDYSVDAPDMSVEGVPTVTVSYLDQTANYNIVINAIAEVKPEESAPSFQEESQEGGKLRYDKSFTARLIQSDDEVKDWYNEIKNHLLSYKKVKDRMSWKRESYRMGRDMVAKMFYRGKTLCICLPLDPVDFVESKYKVEDASESASYADTPCMYRIKNERRAKYATELIDIVLESLGSVRTDREMVDYYLPYEGTVELINKGLVKRNIKTSADEAIFNRAAEDDE